VLAAAARTTALEHTWERSWRELRAAYELALRRSARPTVLAAA
jgi:hypothetical protein